MAGQIINRKNDTWLVRIFTWKDSKGNRKYLNKTIHGTEKDAQHYLTAKLREKDLGISLEASVLIVSDFLDQWLETGVRPRVSPRTADGYASLLERYIRKSLGQKKA